MNIFGTFIYLYFLILLVATGCTKISPQLGFGLLKSSDDSLTIESNVETINSTSANSTILLKGLCEAHTNLTITGPSNMDFKCENLSYLKELPAILFREGENVISIAAFDNSQNKIAQKNIKIVKDTIPPTITTSGPTTVPSSDLTVPISGTCSENGLDVTIENSAFGTSANVRCLNGGWTYSAPVPSGSLVTLLSYKAQQADAAGNITTTISINVTRILLAAFTIDGVRNFNGEIHSNLLRRNTGNLFVDWTASTAVSSYDVYIERNYLSSPVTICTQTGILSTVVTLSLTAGCTPNAGETLRVKILGWDATHSTSVTGYYIFSVKAAPALRSDAKILYINSNPDNAVSTIAISYADLITDPVAAGPFTVTVTDIGSLSGMVAANNLSSTRALNISPTMTVSGIFPIKIKIADENSLTSDELVLKIAIVYPYSWTGSVSNDFSNKSNWCGVAGLKTGCSAAVSLADSTKRVFIDNLCELPTPDAVSVRCASKLTADTTVRSMHLKYGSFSQENHIFSIGTLSDPDSYFKMSSGAFNDGSAGGNLNVFRLFQVEAGVFNAPKNAEVNLNTNKSSPGSEAFKVLNTYNYFHNNSTLILSDPTGLALTQNISVPSGFSLYNLTINSNGGYWGIKSSGLNITGDLTLSGTKDSSSNYPLLNSAVAGAKINLYGNLNCTGAFGGGNLPIYIAGSAAKYETTYAGCKLPQINVVDTSAHIAESTSSSEDTTLNSLSVAGGTFSAPASSRKLIFKSYGLDNNSLVADLNNGGFLHNNGTVVFETASFALNYKISLPGMYDLIFTNPSNLSSFYDIQNNFVGSSFSLKGSYNVPVRGSGRIVTVSQLTFDIGFVVDANQLTRVVQQSSGISYINVNTSSRINIPQVEMRNAYGFLGSSLKYDFSGTTFVLSTNDVIIIPFQELKYYAKTGTWNITGFGSFTAGL